MWTGAVYKRRWLKNADLIFIGCSNFSCIRTAVQTADPDVIVHSSRNYLNSFEIISQNHNIASRCVRLYEWNTYIMINLLNIFQVCFQTTFTRYHIFILLNLYFIFQYDTYYQFVCYRW